MTSLPALPEIERNSIPQEEQNLENRYHVLARGASYVALAGAGVCYFFATKYALNAEFQTAGAYYAVTAASVGASFGCHREAVDTAQHIQAADQAPAQRVISEGDA